MHPVNRDNSSMSVFAWAEELERREASRRHMSREDVRPFVASSLGLLPGTLENIVRRRLKEPGQRVIDAVRNAFIRELEAEIRRCEHEIQIARATGVRADEAEILEAQTHIEAAKRLIGR